MARLRRITAWFICMALVLSFIPAGEVQAAVKVKKCKITLARTAYTYTKKAIKPKVTVKYKSKKLKTKKNYTVSYKNNKKVGTAAVVIKGKGGYKGTVKKKFQIVPKLSATKVSVDVGGAYTLKAVSSAKVAYKSSDTSVATVSNKGVITGVKDGVATITVTSNKVKNTCEVTVGNGNSDPGSTDNPIVNNYRLSETDRTINVGDNTASISILNEDGSVYSGSNAAALSSNETLIHARYIGNGIIELYAHDEGVADVTVTVEGRTLVCHITAVTAGGNSGNGGNSNSDYNNLSTGQLNMNIGDAGSFGRKDDFATKTIASYESSNKTIATVCLWDSDIETGGFTGVDKNEFFVEAVGVGTAVITVTATDGTKGCLDVTVSDSGIKLAGTNSTSNYTSTADSSADGSFTYGQSASSVIGAKDLETTYGEKYNHPSGLAYYKTGSTVYFVVTDAWNNRVLIYTGSSISDATSKVPAVILGQSNIDSCTPGYASDKMNWPMDCAVNSENGMLYVADTHNNRILVYDNIATLVTGAAADHIIDWFSNNHGTHNNHLYWPWAVSTDVSGKLIVTSTLGGNVLIWNTLPATWEKTDENYYPDIIMNTGLSTTPRTIIWTGKQLIIGDENVPNVGNGLYVFNSFPTAADLKEKADTSGDKISFSENTISESKKQAIVKVESPGAAYLSDTVLAGGYGEGCMIDGKLYMAYASCIRTWKDGSIDSSSDTGDVYTNQCRDYEFAEAGGAFLYGGGLWKSIYAEGNLYLALHNANKIIGWSGVGAASGKLDTSSVSAYQKTSKPDITIGDKGGVIHNPIPVTDGSHLVVLDDLGQSIYVYKNIPTSSGAEPDYTYTTQYEIGDAALHSYTESGVSKTAFIMTSRTHNVIYIWKDYKFDGAMPDAVLGCRIGSKYFQGEMEYIEFDGSYTYISTCVAGEYTVLIYRGIPSKESEPVGYIKGINSTTDISSNGTNISVINRNDENDVELWIFETSALAAATSGSPVTFNGTNARTVDCVNIGETPTEENDPTEYRECIDNKFNIYTADIDGTEYKTHEKTTLGGAFSTLLTGDGKYIVCDMAEDRVIIWNSVDDAVNKVTPVILGHGKNMYDFDDMMKDTSTYGYHDVQEAIFADTLSMPRYLAFDGKNLWVGEFKFSNRLLRYGMK